MKIFLTALSVFLISGLCNISSGNDKGKNDTADSTFNPEALLSVSDAEKILGEPAILKESAVTIENGASVYKSSYVALKEDTRTGKTGIIYFMFESYSSTEAAKEMYSSIKRSNEDHEGIKVLKDMGDEAYYHSSDNFYFILVRKGEKMFRMKVNKTTSKSSDDEFMLAASRIAGAM